MSSPEDTTVWQTIGHDLVRSFIAVTIETFGIAIYSVLILETGRLLLRKTCTKVSVYTCIAVLGMFILAIAQWLIDIHLLVAEVEMARLSTSNDSLSNDYAAALSSTLRLMSVKDILYYYMTIIGDGIIIWRVYAFWSSGRERLILLIPGTLFLGSVSTSVILTYCATRLGVNVELNPYQHLPFCRNIQTALFSTTLAITTVSTAFIAYKSWKYWQMHLDAFGSSSPRTRTLKVMLMLIESGILYVLYFGAQVAMSISSVDYGMEQNTVLTFALTIGEYVSSLIVGVYPTVIVVLVHSKHSVLHSSVDPISSTVVFQQLQRFQATSESTTVHPSRGDAAGIAGRAMDVRDRNNEIDEMT